MHAKKQNQGNSDEEVNRACRLLTAEPVPQCGDHGRDGRRHRQSGEDDQRKQYEDDREVSEPLDRVVCQRLFFRGALQAQVVPDDT